MKKSVLLLGGMLLFGGMPLASHVLEDKPKAAPASRSKVKEATLFGVQKVKDDWYFSVPDSLLGRPFISVTRFVTTPAGASKYGGELANEQVLAWEKRGEYLLLRALNLKQVADSNHTIAKAVENSGEDPIIASLKIENGAAGAEKEVNAAKAAPNPDAVNALRLPDNKPSKKKAKKEAEAAKKDSTASKAKAGAKAYRVKVTELFKGDHPVLSIAPVLKTMVGAGSLRPDLSYIDTIRSYPINTEVTTVKTFTPRGGSPIPGLGGGLPEGASTGSLTFRINTSLVLLPKEPMRARTFDPRVGYFTEDRVLFTDDQQSVRPDELISRYRLEPKEEDLDKMRRGELVEPKKQIVYYIDPATPKKWVKYLIQGVNDWNVAFEQAGFKNAICAKEWPNDSTMSTEDARFCVIRYLASPIANAYGPHISDPRSGEILESHIGWYHNVMQLVHDWYMIQGAAVDDRARKMKFDDELMGQLIRFVSSHEVGHTLGLCHNMGSSSCTPVEKLRDKEWVEKHGHTASIMDYARFNYVAQPEDGIGEKGMFPRINDYDTWAIEWGYKYFPDAKSEKEERTLLHRMTVDRLANNPRLWFGGEGRNNDPRAQTEDLGDDAMKASDYGLKNLKRIVGNLDKWSYEEGDLGQNLEQVYEALIGQVRRYEGHVLRNIGGVYQTPRSVDDKGAAYETMERSRQRRALQWIEKNIIAEPSWIIAPSYVNRITGTPERLIRPLGETAVGFLVSSACFNRIATQATGKDPYQPAEFVRDLVQMFFGMSRTGASLTSWQRFIQQQAVSKAIKAWKSTTDGDGRPHMTSFLRQVQQRLQGVKNADHTTMAHYSDLLLQMRLAFEGK